MPPSPALGLCLPRAGCAELQSCSSLVFLGCAHGEVVPGWTYKRWEKLAARSRTLGHHAGCWKAHGRFWESFKG